MVEILPLAALAAPYLIWPIEIYLGVGVWLEEFVKLGFAWQIKKEVNDKAKSLQLFILLTGLFAFSESALYLYNLNLLNKSLMDFLLRLMTTIPMHIFTGLVIYYFYNKNRRLCLIIGMFLAILLHYLFNILSKLLI